MKNGQNNMLALAIVSVLVGMTSAVGAEPVDLGRSDLDIDVETESSEYSFDDVFGGCGFDVEDINGNYDASVDVSAIGDAIIRTDSRTYDDAYDCAFGFAVGDITVGVSGYETPDAIVEKTEDSSGNIKVEGGLQENLTEGVDARMTYSFFSDRPVVRVLYTLSNTTSADIAESVYIGGNYGSDGSTTLEATFSGQLNPDTEELDIYSNDLWYMTSDDDSSDPILTLTTHGSYADVVPVNIMKPMDGSDDFLLQYSVVIPAGESIIIMIFSEMTAYDKGFDLGIESATQSAADFESLETLERAGLLEGMSEESLASLVNYARLEGGGAEEEEVVEEEAEVVEEGGGVAEETEELTPETPADDNVSSGGSSSGGALSFPLLLIGGLLAFRRKRA
ncbi:MULTISPECIES: hypothetical protein [unclassified Thalassolituus]|uniref:hypothetical protein n=1 Tax=unclassified Thalassolituus TaxID=2624967 RepID=UPI0025DFD5C3|nr:MULTISPECIES: hypothetical protein [unclassified Thalassolituus]|tara:strand:- start:1850 stop:3028 length:1179 start_codon:yes stop_codon:yes gene_type:complete